jgi:hypothetical protein
MHLVTSNLDMAALQRAADRTDKPYAVIARKDLSAVLSKIHALQDQVARLSGAAA